MLITLGPDATVAPPMTNAQHAAGRLLNVEDLALADLQPPEIWERTIGHAIREGCSDVHLAFQDGRLHVALRLDGRLQPQGSLPAEPGQKLANHVKVAAKLDPAEKRRPQDGHIVLDTGERLVDLRVSVLPTSQGESVAIRIQDRERGLLDLEQLGLGQRQLGALRELFAAPSGLVLVTGPTGAGKTTTLYAILRSLADGTRKVVSIENPVEYELPGIEQAEVNYKLGLDYATLLRAALRHDPNVIMIGEVRDAETAQAVVRAANSGRLVFATSHAVEAAAAVESLVALGAHPHFLARSLRGAIAQTLVRRLCPYCTIPLAETADSSLLENVRHLLGPHEQAVLSMGRGCPHCRHTGYRGRLGVFEVLQTDQRVRAAIARSEPAQAVADAARSAGMTTLGQAGRLAALRGLTTVEELVQNVAEVWTLDE